MLFHSVIGLAGIYQNPGNNDWSELFPVNCWGLENQLGHFRVVLGGLQCALQSWILTPYSIPHEKHHN